MGVTDRGNLYHKVGAPYFPHSQSSDCERLGVQKACRKLCTGPSQSLTLDFWHRRAASHQNIIRHHDDGNDNYDDGNDNYDEMCITV